MDKYFLEILKSVNTIIIPGLGALTITNVSTGEIMFMSYLNYDDGKLVEFISKKEDISENEARNLIAKYVRDIEAKLNSGESYDIFQFGSFSKNASRETEFTQWDTEKSIIQNVSSPVEPKAELKDPETEQKESETPPTDINQTILKKAVKKTSKRTKSIEKDKEPEITEEKIIRDGVTPAIQEINNNNDELINEQIDERIIENIDSTITTDLVENELPSTSYTEEDQWKDDLDIPPITIKTEQQKKPILEKVKRDKKKKRPTFYALLVLGVLFIGGTLTFIMFYNSLEKFIPFMAKEETETKNIKHSSETDSTNIKTKNTEEVIDQKQQLKETLKVNSIKIPTVLEEEIQTANFIQTSTGKVDRNKPFHIIGGAFSDKVNADRYFYRLIKEGNPAIIIGRFDRLFIVSITSYESQEAANSALPNLRSISQKAWIFRWP
jgi:nucleoid DNA-binding protein